MSNLEEQYKSIKTQLESKKNEQIQIQADINSIDSQLSDLQQEAQALGISDLTQLDTIINERQSALQAKLQELSSKLTPVQPLSEPTIPNVVQSTQPVTPPVTPVQSDVSLDMSAFGDFGL